MKIVPEVTKLPESMNLYYFKLRDSDTQQNGSTNQVAWALLGVDQKKAPGVMMLFYIWVEPPYRRQGHAVTLLKMVQEKCEMLWTDWDGSTDDSRAMCIKADMFKKTQKGRVILAWERPKKREFSPKIVKP